MMDSSGSMKQATAQNNTKWQVVSQAIESFMADSESQNVGMSLSFFPHVNEGVPSVCQSDDDCGMPDACEPLGRCQPKTPSTYCLNDGHCPDGDTCEQISVCADLQSLCSTPGQACSGNKGACELAGLCDNRESCEIEDYATPAVALGLIAANKNAIASAMASRLLRESTPTWPALEGATQQASLQMAAFPERKAVVVLASDGLANDCDSTTEQLVASAKKAFDSNVDVYAVGVFGVEDDADKAKAQLDAVAQAGGTENMHLVDTSANPAAAFLEALREVRLATSCSYVIGEIDKTVLYDYAGVTLAHANGESNIARVASRKDCHPQGGGFYYEPAYDGMTPPTRISLCPASCKVFAPAENKTVTLHTQCLP
jgi:hypothetical protein